MFESIGDGWCRPYGCEILDDSCRLNGYWKDESNDHECRTTCSDDSACTGFSISEPTFSAYPNRCFLYGNKSFKKEETGWEAYPTEYFSIHTTNIQQEYPKYEDVHCYRRIGNYFSQNTMFFLTMY